MNHDENECINMVIPHFGLAKVSDPMVGTQVIHGVFGGERERASIWMDLITSPSILILKEPPTGLDSSSLNAILLPEERVPKQGQTIIFSTYPPCFSLFKLFDRLTSLASGKLIFHWPAQEALGYWGTLHQLVVIVSPMITLLPGYHSWRPFCCGIKQRGWRW